MEEVVEVKVDSIKDFNCSNCIFSFFNLKSPICKTCTSLIGTCPRGMWMVFDPIANKYFTKSYQDSLDIHLDNKYLSITTTLRVVKSN